MLRMQAAIISLVHLPVQMAYIQVLQLALWVHILLPFLMETQKTRQKALMLNFSISDISAIKAKLKWITSDTMTVAKGILGGTVVDSSGKVITTGVTG